MFTVWALRIGTASMNTEYYRSLKAKGFCVL